MNLNNIVVLFISNTLIHVLQPSEKEDNDSVIGVAAVEIKSTGAQPNANAIPIPDRYLPELCKYVSSSVPAIRCVFFVS